MQDTYNFISEFDIKSNVHLYIDDIYKIYKMFGY